MDAAIKFPINKTAPINFPRTPPAVKAGRPKLGKHMSIERAYQAIIRNCIDQIQANEAGVAKYHDMECLHQMRVGLRRLRSAQAMFRALITVPDEIANDVEWLVSQLGPARDWDVLAGSTLPKIGEESAQLARLVELSLAAQDKAHELHRMAAEAVSSERYSQMMLALTGWVERRGWHDRQTAKERGRLKKGVSKFARALLERDQQRLAKRGRKLRTATPEARHRVRIAAKKTRYAAEFFGSLYKRARVKRYVKALTVLQDELGWLNDAAVAQRLLDELAHSRGQLRESVAFARGYLSARSREEDRRLTKAWRRFAPLRTPC